MKVKTRFRVICAIVVGAFILLSCISMFLMSQISGVLTNYSKDWTPVIISSTNLESNVKSLRLYEYRHVATSVPSEMSDSEAQIADVEASIKDEITELDTLLGHDPKGAAAIKQIEQSVNSYMTISNEVISESKALGADPSLKIGLVSKIVQNYDNYLSIKTSIEEIINDHVSEADAGAVKAVNIYHTAIIVLIVCSILIAALGIFLVLGLQKAIITPLKEINGVAIAIADGDLNQKITYAADDEFGITAANFNRTVLKLNEYTSYITEIAAILNELANGNLQFKINSKFDGEFAKVKEGFDRISDSLNSTMAEINRSSDNVALGADQMSTGAQALSQGTTEQASSVEELAATIHDISDNIHTTAQHADNARNAALKAGEEVNVSNAEMQEMIAAMNEISTTSGEIGKIIKTIEDIAFQTNILALNASVEAARAGSAGKGFAVVADEVRNLANKSAEAANDTTALIETSLKAVSNGTEIADRTAASLLNVVTQFNQVLEMVGNISEAAETQAVAISQVNEGVSQISSVIQTSSATAEESAASSEELASQAQLLKNLVSNFKIDESYPSSAASSASDSNSFIPSYSKYQSSYTAPAEDIPAPVARFEKPEVIIRPKSVSQIADHVVPVSDNSAEHHSVSASVDAEYMPDDDDSKY